MNGRPILWLSAIMGVLLIGFGIYAVVALDQFMGMTGFTMNGVLGHSEARAIYTGSMIAMGGLTLYAVQDATARSGILLAVGVTFLGFVAGRILSMMLDGYDPGVIPAIVFELVTTIVLLTAALSRKRAVGTATDTRGLNNA
jgi:hypothetical protein